MMMMMMMHINYDIHKYTVSQKKRHPFYFCDNFLKCRPILLIKFGRNTHKEFVAFQ